MFYKYKKIVTEGAFGTSIAHKSTDDNPIFTLGEIGLYTYIQADNIVGQNESLVFTSVTLTEEESQELKEQRFLKTSKKQAENRIRKIKSLEDDVTDQKILIQFLARGLVSIHSILTEQQKANLPYKENFEVFATAVIMNNVRLDKEENQVGRVMEIIADEVTFADIAEEEYLSKK